MRNAYAISHGLLRQIENVIRNFGRMGNGGGGYMMPVPGEDQAGSVWFKLTSQLSTCGEGNAKPVQMFTSQDCKVPVVRTLGSDFTAIRVFDGAGLIDGTLQTGRVIRCVQVGDRWLYSGGVAWIWDEQSNSFQPGGGVSSIIGKTTAAIAKATSGTVAVHTVNGATTTALSLAPPGGGAAQPVQFTVYNRYADLDTDKFVRFSPCGELISAEC